MHMVTEKIVKPEKCEMCQKNESSYLETDYKTEDNVWVCVSCGQSLYVINQIDSLSKDQRKQVFEAFLKSYEEV